MAPDGDPQTARPAAKERWFTFIKLAVFAALVGLVLWLGDLDAIFAGIRRIGAGPISAAIALSYVVVALSAVKWRLIVPAASFAALMRILLIGQFYSFFFIGQASGEAAKAYILSRATGGIGGATVSVLADRLTSLIGLLIVSAAGFALSSSPYPPVVRQTLLAVLAGTLLMLGALRLDSVFLRADRAAAALEKATPRWPWLARALRHAIEQWRIAVADPKRIAAAISLGGLIHVGNVATIAVLAEGVGIHLPILDWCWIAGLMSIAGFIPVTIGQVTAGGALVGLLRLFPVPVSEAVALSVVILGVNFSLALAGAILEWRRLQRPSQANPVLPP